MKLNSQLFTLIVVLLFTSSASAKTVSLPVTDKIVATAQYETGESDKPLLIFLHGFLQTNEFSR